jgi:glycosyltransferase involved in cell wall biosynthesis
MKRILHVRNSDMYGSPERLIIGQCRQIKTFEWVVATFVRDGGINRFAEESAGAGIETFAIPEKRLADTAIIGRLRRIIKDRQIDMVVSHDYKATCVSWLATRGLGTALIACYHGETTEDVKVRLYNMVDSIMLRKMHRIIAVSQYTRTQLISRGIKEKRIVVVANAIDATALSEIAPIREPLGERPIRMISAGRFSREKGLDLLLDAVASVKDSAPAFKLYLYGKGAEEFRLRKQVELLGLSNIVEFCGFVDDIAPVFRTMDMLVMTSRSEGMPLIILEAWKERLGVVATAVGGIPEMIQSEKNGLLIDSPDVKKISESLISAMNNMEAIAVYGSKGFELLKTTYNYETQAVALLAVYDNVLKERRKA